MGESVTEFKIGEAVDVIPNFSMNEYATYGDLIVVPAASVVKQPVFTVLHGGRIDLDDVHHGL